MGNTQSCCGLQAIAQREKSSFNVISTRPLDLKSTILETQSNFDNLQADFQLKSNSSLHVCVLKYGDSSTFRTQINQNLLIFT